MAVFICKKKCSKGHSESNGCSFLFSDETIVINVFCGVVSGVLSSSLANPTDVLKVSKISFKINHYKILT